ncbi:MAG: winged helix DNA-binding domain-containing protein [Chloroflexi bacterium]|nr:winged helix DNA-binding domain-containing protein [Chloroflexota bacterium]
MKFEEHAPSGVRGVGYRVASAPGWLVHVPPSGRWGSFTRPRYVDASVWLPDAIRPDPEEALRIAIERYLAAYGPASAEDIGKWVGQPRITRVREALEALGERLRRWRDETGRQLVDLAEGPIALGDEDSPVRFLARWDSAIIGYDRRERIMPESVAGLAIRMRNGDFLPTFTIDGFVAGIWLVETARERSTLTLTPAARVPRTARTELTDEAERLVRFVSAEASRHEVRWARR